MMLRNRSRAVTSMADTKTFSSSSSSSYSAASPISSFMGSPRFFNGDYLSSKHPSDSETVVSSPVSILDTKNSSLFVNTFERNQSRSSTPSPETQIHTNNKAIGLALIDSIIEETSDENLSKPINRMVLLGSKLKVQIPVTNSPKPPPLAAGPHDSSMDSPKSPAEFGIKTRSPQLASPLSRSRHLIRQLSLKEMELSEDYTCVISHGPNPKTTHIFDEYIVESSCADGHHVHDISGEMKPESTTSSPANFLGFCDCCKDVLNQDKAIYTRRGEKAFCSHECRFQEMMLLEGMKNPEADLNGSF